MIDLTPAFSELFEPFEVASQSDWRFVHYTTAESALQIIESGKVWMRNAELMNDFEEIQGGLEKVLEFFGSETGQPLWDALNEIEDGLSRKTGEIFEAWRSDLISNTYMLCLSKHNETEDNDGRLSMWRAYAADRGVAIVIRGTELYREQSVTGVFTVPAIYMRDSELAEMFTRWRDRLIDMLASFSEDPRNLPYHIGHFLRLAAIAIKHPGFSEEQEWRLVFRPSEHPGSLVVPAVRSVGRAVQTVYEMPLEISDEDSVAGTGYSLDSILDRLIVGPSNHRIHTMNAFSASLEAAGVVAASDRVEFSEIPLR